MSVLALALTATGCQGTTGASDTRATTVVDTVADRVEPLKDTDAPRLPVTVESADGRKVKTVAKTAMETSAVIRN